METLDKRREAQETGQAVLATWHLRLECSQGAPKTATLSLEIGVLVKVREEAAQETVEAAQVRVEACAHCLKGLERNQPSWGSGHY